MELRALSQSLNPVNVNLNPGFSGMNIMGVPRPNAFTILAVINANSRPWIYLSISLSNTIVSKKYKVTKFKHIL